MALPRQQAHTPQIKSITSVSVTERSKPLFEANKEVPILPFLVHVSAFGAFLLNPWPA